MIDRFQFHGEVVGFAGRITLPFDEVIPVQASCALPESGGYGSNNTSNFRYRDMISVDSASSQVVGAFSAKDDSFETLATVTVEGLNVMNVVTADRIVARIASRHPNDPAQDASIIPLGSYFEGLRIAGQPLECVLAHNSYFKFDSMAKVRLAYQNDTDGFRTEFNNATLWGQAPAIPAELRVYFPWSTQPLSPPVIPANRPTIPSSLIRNILTPQPPLVRFAHVIQVPGFGVVRLAEIKLTRKRLRLTMLMINFGSIPEGDFICASGEGNGSDW